MTEQHEPKASVVITDEIQVRGGFIIPASSGDPVLVAVAHVLGFTLGNAHGPSLKAWLVGDDGQTVLAHYATEAEAWAALDFLLLLLDGREPPKPLPDYF